MIKMKAQLQFAYVIAFRNLSLNSPVLCYNVTKVSKENKSQEDEKRIRRENYAKKPSCPLCGVCLKNDTLNYHLKKYHSKMIDLKLREDPMETYSKIFGRENIKTISHGEIRWPNGLIVTLGSSAHGLWYDFKNGVGGGPISAIMYAKNMEYIDALKFAATKFDYSGVSKANYNFEKSSGFTEDDSPSKIKEMINVDFSELKKKDKEVRIKKAETAQFLWSKAQPIGPSNLGQKYLLVHRKIPGKILAHLEFKFIPNGTKYSLWNATKEDYEVKSMPYPAIVVPVENIENKVVAIQRIFLDPVTGKKSGDKAKFTLGDLKGNAAIIHRGKIGADVLVIAEGPETAASLADATFAVGNKIPILASLSLGNMQNMKSVIVDHWKPKKVIIAADNDNEENLPQVISDLENFLRNSGIEVVIAIPQLESRTKCDWNDVLKAHGRDYLRNIFLPYIISKEEK